MTAFRRYLLVCWLLTVSCCVSPSASGAELTAAVLGSSDPNSAVALTDAVSSYQMLSPSIAISVATPVSETDALLQLVNGTLDFISTTMMLSPNLTAPASPLFNAAASDLLWCPFLIAPLVPIYRLDSVTTTLSLSTATLCSIYTGRLQWWNDSRIAILNPAVTLPSTPITVVVEAVRSSLTLAFTQAMSTLCGSFAHSIGVTADPVWPSASYAGYVPSVLPASTVLVVNGAIGFTTLPTAVLAKVNVAALTNMQNQTIVASALSATFAATEMLAMAASVSTASKQPVNATTLMPATLANPNGQQAWPMTVVSAFVIHTNTTRRAGNCNTRAALLSFIHFMYSSSAASAVLANRHYAPYPTVALNDLSLPGRLDTSVLCADGSLAFSLASSQSLQSTAAATTSHTLHGDSRFSAVLSLLTGLFTAAEKSAGHEIDVNYSGSSDIWEGVEAVLSGEGEAALLSLDLLNLTQEAAVLAARDSGRFYLLPFFISAMVAVYNPTLTAAISLPPTLTMDPVTLISAAGQYVTDWRSPLLASVVAPLALSNLTTPLPIRLIAPCDSSAPGAPLREFYSVFVPYAPTLPDYLYNTTGPLYAHCDSAAYDSSAFVSGVPHAFFPAPTGAAVPSIVNAVSGALSFQRATASVEAAVVLVDFGRGVGGIAANVSSMLACLDSFDGTTMMAALNTSTDPSCYLFSRTVYALVPTSIVDVEEDGCTERRHLLEFLSDLSAGDSWDALLNDQLLVRAGQVEAVQVAVLNALNSITCVNPVSGESDTLLVQTPVVWSLSSAITTVGLALGSVGIVCAVAAFAVTAVFHRHSVMRAASPMFLCLTLLGLAVLFVSSLMLSMSPSTESCAGLSWCFHLGFQLAFAPLLAKTYRVYRIYGGQKLSVVKLSNSRLALIVAGLLTMEVALLAAFQIVSPMRPLTVSRTSGSPLRLHEYGQCSVDSTGMPLFVALCVEKGVVLLLGALMAFSTRRVSATYSESSSIAWSIYNLILSMAVLVPLVLLIDAVGDTLVALLLFALLWVSAFTLTVLFVPRLTAMLSKAETLDEHDSGARVIGDDGFSFLSLASFEAGSGAMGQYVAALELHLAQAKARHSQLKHGDSKGKEWMKATVGGRKQSVASLSNDNHNSRAGQQPQRQPQQQQPEQRKAREKSIATATGAPKASLSYMTQTNYSNEGARSITGSPTPATGQRSKPILAPSGRTTLPTNSASNIMAAAAFSSSASSIVAQESPTSSSPQQPLFEQKMPPPPAVTQLAAVSAVESASSVRPSSSSVSRSRSIRVQPSFEKAVSPPLEKRPNSALLQAAAETQPDDSSVPEETKQPDTTAADSSQYSLPALPVADDMVVHDLSTRMARASIDEGPAADNALVVRSTTVMRARGSSRGILMTPVTGSTTLSNTTDSSTDVSTQAAGDAHGGDLDIESGGDAMHDQDIE